MPPLLPNDRNRQAEDAAAREAARAGRLSNVATATTPNPQAPLPPPAVPAISASPPDTVPALQEPTPRVGGGATATNTPAPVAPIQTPTQQPATPATTTQQTIPAPTTQQPATTTTQQPQPNTRDIEAMVQKEVDAGATQAEAAAGRVTDALGQPPEPLDLTGRADILIEKYGILGFNEQLQDLGNQLAILTRNRDIELAQASLSPTTSATLFGRRSQIQQAGDILINQVQAQINNITTQRRHQWEVISAIMQYEKADYDAAFEQYQTETNFYLRGKELELRYGAESERAQEVAQATLQTYIGAISKAAIKERRNLTAGELQVIKDIGSSIPGFNYDAWSGIAQAAVVHGTPIGDQKVAGFRDTPTGTLIIFEDGTTTEIPNALKAQQSAADVEKTRAQTEKLLGEGGDIWPGRQDDERAWDVRIPVELWEKNILGSADREQLKVLMNSPSQLASLLSGFDEGVLPRGVSPDVIATVGITPENSKAVFDFLVGEQVRAKYASIIDEMLIEYNGLTERSAGDLIVGYAVSQLKNPLNALQDDNFRSSVLGIDGVTINTSPNTQTVRVPVGDPNSPVTIPVDVPVPTTSKPNTDFNAKAEATTATISNGRQAPVKAAANGHRNGVDAFSAASTGGAGWNTDDALAVMSAESGGRSIQSTIPETGPNSYNGKEDSWGLFQIHVPSHRARLATSAFVGQGATDQQIRDWLLNPSNNIRYAYDLYTRQGWQPWTEGRKLGLGGQTTPRTPTTSTTPATTTPQPDRNPLEAQPKAPPTTQQASITETYRGRKYDTGNQNDRDLLYKAKVKDYEKEIKKIFSDIAGKEGRLSFQDYVDARKAQDAILNQATADQERLQQPQEEFGFRKYLVKAASLGRSEQSALRKRLQDGSLTSIERQQIQAQIDQIEKDLELFN